jgi:hypothetical protein
MNQSMWHTSGLNAAHTRELAILFGLLLGAIFLIVLGIALLSLRRRHRGIQQESVTFEPAPGGRGTIVRVQFDYDHPGRTPAAPLSKFIGKHPGQIAWTRFRARRRHESKLLVREKEGLGRRSARSHDSEEMAEDSFDTLASLGRGVGPEAELTA